jgi:hypothetical protein
VGRARGVRSWKADDEQAIVDELGRLGQDLGKGELRLEAAGGQVALIMKLPRVGDPLVDQDQAGPVLLEQLAQHVTGACRPFVVGLDTGKGLLATKLPGQLAPERANDSPIGLGDGVTG